VLLVLGTVTVLADHIGFSGPTYPVTGAPRAVIAMDLDADGKTDFASADMHSDTVTLYRGDGTGALTLWSVLALPGGAGPFDITAADLNRDGTNDLIVANADNHTVAIFLSKHGGVPGDTGRLTLRVAGSPRGVAVADVNRDGKLDLAVTGAACSCVAVLRNDGAGAFTEMARIGGLGQPHGIAVGDFNRDDIPDLAVASPGANAVHVLVGDGRFRFASRRYGPAPATRALAVLDYDRDGWPDLVSANTTSSDVQPVISVFHNDRGVLRYTAEAAAHPDSVERAGDRRGIALLNVDGDGWPDLAVSVRSTGVVHYYNGTGTEFFGRGGSDEVRFPTPAGGGARGLAVAHMDEDAKPDIVVANEYDRSVTVLRNFSQWSTDHWY